MVIQYSVQNLQLAVHVCSRMKHFVFYRARPLFFRNNTESYAEFHRELEGRRTVVVLLQICGYHTESSNVIRAEKLNAKNRVNLTSVIRVLQVPGRRLRRLLSGQPGLSC